MAKDKKHDGNLGQAQNAGQDNTKKASQGIDVSSVSLEENKSDSDLDIQALLRKYMPEYDEDGGDDAGDTGVLSRLKKSAEAETDAEDPFAAEEDGDFLLPEEEDEDPLLLALDSAFSDLPADEQQPEAELAPAKKLEADDFMFTDDIPAQVDDSGELEDEEGIYEDDDAVSRPPRRKKESRGGFFGFGRRNKKQKQDDEFADLPDNADEEVPEEDESDALLASLLSEQAGEDPAILAADESADEPAEALDDGADDLSADLLADILAGTTDEADDGESGEEDGLELSDTLRELGLLENDADAAETDAGVSDAEMLKLAEDLLGDSLTGEEAAEAEEASDGAAAGEDEDFDPTDINLMVAFGMDDGDDGKKKAGKTARQLGDKLEHEKVLREGRKVKLDRPEYVDRSQNAEIEKSYKNKMLALWIKLGLCGVFTVLLMLFENIEVLAKLFTGTAKQFGGVFDPAIYPVVYAMVSLQLMLLACLCAYEQIIKGFVYLVRGVPKPESMTAMLTLAGILYTIVVARITVQSDEPVMFNFIVASAALMTLIGEIFNTRREMLNFKIVSSTAAKHIVCRVSDEESREEATAFSEEDDVCDVMRIEKADFINGFFNRLYTPDGTTNMFMSCAMGVMAAAAVLFGIFASIRGGSGVEVARVVCISLMTVAPLSVYLSLSYPFYRANVAAGEFESAIIGEASLEEYSNASIVTFDDKNVFPSYSVKVQNIRIFNNARIDRVLYYAASVFAKAGGPLQDVFEVATLEVGHSDNVDIYDTETGFLAAEVDGVNIIFGSGAALSRKGLKIRRQELEDDVDLSDELSIMYMFREDKLVAKMYIQYVMDSDIELILSQFQNSGLYGCVRTCDPNIDERMIARKVNMKRMPLKVIRYNGADEAAGYTEKVDSGLVTCGSPKSLLQIISYCDKVLHTRKTNFALAILAILVGAAIMLLLVLSGSVGVVNSLYILLYQLLWLVPMLMSSKMFIR